MNTFDCESSIASWRKDLASRQALEPGDIEELESHLRDAIEANVENGFEPPDAFCKGGCRSGFRV